MPTIAVELHGDRVAGDTDRRRPKAEARYAAKGPSWEMAFSIQCVVETPDYAAEWRRGRGNLVEVPEVDEGRFFGFREAEDRMHGWQDAFLGRLRELLRGGV